MDTERLIRTLAEQVHPVRPLRRPWRRTLAWTAVGAVYLIGLVMVMSPRSDLDRRMQDPWFLIEQVAALLTGVGAAAAAFATVVPAYRRSVVAWPVGAAAIWLAVVGAGAFREFSREGAALLLLQADWGCVWTILAVASVPAVVIGRMLQRGAPLTPRLTAALGGLAAAGLANLGICLFHAHTSNLVLLVWHCGTVLAVAALAGLAGGRVLSWPRNFCRA